MPAQSQRPREAVGVWPDLWLVPLVLIGTFAGAWLGHVLSFEPRRVAGFWLANAAVLTALLLVPPRRWWAYLVALIVGVVAACIPQGVAWLPTLGLVAVHGAEVLLIAILLRLGSGSPGDPGRFCSTLRFVVCAGALGPAMAGALGAGLAAGVFGTPEYWLSWRAWSLGTALGHLTLTVLLLNIARSGPVWLRQARVGTRAAELLVLLAAGVAVGIGTAGMAPQASGVLSYAPLPLLLWAAARFGTGGVSAMSLILALFLSWSARFELGSFGGLSPSENVFAVQLFLLAAVVPTLLLGASVDEHKRTEAELRDARDALELRVAERTGALRESQRVSEAISDTTPALVYIYDPLARRNVYANRRCEEFFGLSAEAIQAGGPEFFAERIHPDDLPTHEQEIQRYAHLAPGTVLENDLRLLDRHGSWCQFHTREVVLDRDAQGSALRIVGIAIDVSDRRAAEEALRKSEATLRSLVQAAPIGIGLVTNRVLGWVNPQLTVINGYSAEELQGRSARILYPSDEEYERVGRVKHAAIRACGVGAIETRFHHKDGRILDVLLSSAVIDPDDWSAGLVFTVTDITAWKEAERERRKLEAQIQHAQKLESLGVLAGGIAHDFNNLLVGILGNADLALRDLPPDAPARQSLEGIETAARRAADLTRQMLAYSGKGRFLAQPVDLNAVVREMIQLLRVALSRKAVLQVALCDGLPCIEADATQMRQVVMNLITNASEAIGDRPGVITIRTGVRHVDRAFLEQSHVNRALPAGEFVVLDVADTGVGMDAETQAKIFEPFFTTKFTGRGLGLAAVLGIVRGHGGALRVYSAPDAGSTFQVLLPARRDLVAGAGAPDSSDERAESTARGTVLLVDDDETVRNVGARMLAHAGYQVVTAADGAAALELYRGQATRICCVVLDLTMPGMGGEETFRALRDLRPDVRVVLSSGYNEQEVTQRFADAGLAGFIQKPYRQSDLVEVIRRVCPAESSR